MNMKTPLAMIALLVSSIVNADVQQIRVCPGNGKPCETVTIIRPGK